MPVAPRPFVFGWPEPKQPSHEKGKGEQLSDHDKDMEEEWRAESRKPRAPITGKPAPNAPSKDQGSRKANRIPKWAKIA